MRRIRVNEVIIVEGKYDATALANLVDGLILTTEGFSIFSDEEKKELIRRLGARRGIVILTDSDAAGFKIRHYIEKIAQGCAIRHAYIPAVSGKEKRKSAPSKEGTLGVEGLPAAQLIAALQAAGVGCEKTEQRRKITFTDLYEFGLSGTQGSAARRREWLRRIGLPPRLSKRALPEVLSSLYSYEEFVAMMEEKPVLFWDFHGTLSLPDVTWYDAAMEAARELVPEVELRLETLIEHFSRTCLPWWSVPDRDTRHLVAPGAWWAHCENEFRTMFVRCGYTPEQAALLAPALREKVLDARRYSLYPDAISTLQALQKHGYRHYILSNNYPELENITDFLGLTPLLEGVLVSGKIGYDKPRQEIFDIARRTAGNPAEVWMIGDNPNDDIQGAKAAGFKTVSVHKKEAPEADYTVDSLSEILKIFLE